MSSPAACSVIRNVHLGDFMPQNDGCHDDLWLSPQETAALTKVAVQTLANWRAMKSGPRYTKLSSGKTGRIRYRRSDVLAWLNERQVAA
ncbi:helix-turn-helix transcriptional regulator [Streptomyces microflavus]|uniref:helix-turn-helix transcriptional regulator n=1 Tax=Streptomyces microflavus TaxID=1919 RepID=UPI003414EE36